jgi:hypothetical protein
MRGDEADSYRTLVFAALLVAGCAKDPSATPTAPTLGPATTDPTGAPTVQAASLDAQAAPTIVPTAPPPPHYDPASPASKLTLADLVAGKVTSGSTYELEVCVLQVDVCGPCPPGASCLCTPNGAHVSDCSDGGGVRALLQPGEPFSLERLQGLRIGGRYRVRIFDRDGSIDLVDATAL